MCTCSMNVHVCTIYMYVYMNVTGYGYCRALLKFDGDFAPDFGTPPADVVSENYVLRAYMWYRYWLSVVRRSCS